MRAKVLENGELEISISLIEQRVLQIMEREDRDHFYSDVSMRDIFEDLVCNTEYEWIRPEEIGALTSAPILGIRDEVRALREDEDADFMHVVGHWDDQTWVEDTTRAWGFMNYQVRSPQGDLLWTRKCIFTSATKG